MYKHVHVIVNPAAGQDKPVLSILNTVFHDAGLTWEVFVTNEAGDATRFAKQSIEAGVDLIAAYGGDGTIMEVVTGMAGSKIPLAILPGGTGNGASYELGIPGDLTQACQLICGENNDIREMDIGQAGDKYFMLNAGVGLAAAVMENTDRAAKDRFGILAYLATGLQTLNNTPAAQYHLTIDGEQIESEGVTCVIANAGTISNLGLKLAANIDIADGLLDVIVIRKGDLSTLISVVGTVLTGNEDGGRLQHWQAREVTLITEPPQSVQLDGDIAGQTPLVVKVMPKALRVVVPKAVSAASASDGAAQSTQQSAEVKASPGK